MNRGRGNRPHPAAGGAAWRRVLAVAALLPLVGLGCASSALRTARSQFYAGQYDASADTLAKLPGNDTDRVLVLMERGKINETRSHYADSVEDWLRAKEIADRLDYLSVSRETTSLLVNDRVLAYCGAPYERVLIHTSAAESYLAMGLWQDAAVEGRALIRRLENRDKYPDDPYSRYVAALGMEMMGDDGGAEFQYRKTSELVTTCAVSPDTGAVGPFVDTNAPPSKARARAKKPAPPPEPCELVCLVSIGRGPTPMGYVPANARWGAEPYAEIYAGEQYLGRSYTLTRVDDLFNATQKVLATRHAVKEATRLVLKEAAAEAVSEKNDTLGSLLWLALFAMEMPDDRQWETLPDWLEVARVPCPDNLTSYRIVLKSSGGQTIETHVVTAPLKRQDKTYVSLFRAL